MIRHDFSWAPASVRHLFRAADFATCRHGVFLRRCGDIVWAGTHGKGGCGRDGQYGAWFALGHHLEVPGKPRETGLAAFADLARTAEPIDAALVRLAVPGEQFDLALALGVQTWGRVSPDGKHYGALGFVLGLPTCAIAPYARLAGVLAPAVRLAS